MSSQPIPNSGERIRLKQTNDPYTNLATGDEGTVTGIRDAPPTEPGGDPTTQIQVNWDDGSTLSLLAEVDEYTIISEHE